MKKEKNMLAENNDILLGLSYIEARLNHNDALLDLIMANKSIDEILRSVTLTTILLSTLTNKSDDEYFAYDIIDSERTFELLNFSDKSVFIGVSYYLAQMTRDNELRNTILTTVGPKEVLDHLTVLSGIFAHNISRLRCGSDSYDIAIKKARLATMNI